MKHIARTCSRWEVKRLSGSPVTRSTPCQADHTLFRHNYNSRKPEAQSAHLQAPEQLRISWLGPKIQAAMTNKAPTSLSIISHKVCQTTAWHAAPLVQRNSLCCMKVPLHMNFCIECRRLTLLRVYTPGQHGSITKQAACLRGVCTDMRSGKLRNVSGVCSDFAVILKLCRVCKGLTHAQEEEMSSVNETAMAYPTILLPA